MLGKWNKSVVLTYIGLCTSILGMYLGVNGEIHLSFIALIIAGICDLFDGAVARRVKRTDEEIRFGGEIDSLVDVVNFTIFPIILYMSLGLNNIYYLIIYFIYGIFQIVRLAHFNMIIEEDDKPIKYYTGLPVTYTALILPLVYLFLYFLIPKFINIGMAISLLVIGILNTSRIKFIKPRGIAYIVFAILAIIIIWIYLVI